MTDQESIQEYRLNGVALVRGLANSALITPLRIATDDALAAPGPSAETCETYEGKTLSFGQLQVWQKLPAFRDAVLPGPMAQIAAEYMASTQARFFYDEVLVKEPSSKRRTPWHQDNPYWKVAGCQIRSLWLAIDDVDADTSLEFVRQSHEWPEHNPSHFADGSPFTGTGLAALPDIEADQSGYDIVSYALEPGGVRIRPAGSATMLDMRIAATSQPFRPLMSGCNSVSPIVASFFHWSKTLAKGTTEPMRHLRRTLVICAAFVGLGHASIAHGGNANSETAAQLAALHDEIATELLGYDLELRAAKSLGLPQFQDDSLATEKRNAVRAAVLRARVVAIPAAPLAENDRLTRVYLMRLLESVENRVDLWRYSFPVTPYAGGWRHDSIRRLALGTSLTTPADRVAYLSALRSYASLIRSQSAKLGVQADQGIRIPKPAIPGARRVALNLQNSIVAFVPDDARLAKLSVIDRIAFQASAKTIVDQDIGPSVAALVAKLDEDYERAAPETVGLRQYPGGAEAYAALARLNTGTKLTPDQIHAVGLSIIASAQAELELIWTEIGFKGTRAEFVTMIAADPRFSARTPQEVEAHFARAMHRIEPLLSQYFAPLPKAAYAVERAPIAIEQGMTFGFYRSPTPELPVGAYLYNGADPAGRSYANAAALIYHELMPGHHLQIALQQENTAIPLLRRVNGVLPLTAYVEGWAEYAADLAGEMGLYRTPYERYGRVYAQMFLGNRLVVDTGMNALGWSLADACAYMKANTFASDPEIDSELLRYGTDIPGQALAYAMGERELLRMRAEVQKAQGGTFSYPAFHAAVLNPGALPMDLLEEHLRTWRTATERDRSDVPKP
jgi:uncharacterized protein (DUF885 family)